MIYLSGDQQILKNKVDALSGESSTFAILKTASEIEEAEKHKDIKTASTTPHVQAPKNTPSSLISRFSIFIKKILGDN